MNGSCSSKITPSAPDRNSGLWVLDTLIIACVLLVAYGSLVPFDMSGDNGAIARNFEHILDTWPVGDEPYGRRDLAANVLFYAPLGLLVAGRWMSRRRSGRLMPVLAAVVAAAALSLCMEALQLLLPTRTASAGDVTANGVGGLIGGAVSVLCLPSLWSSLSRRLTSSVARPVALAAGAMAFLLVADAVDPLYPVLKLSHLLKNLRASHFQLATGLAVHPWHRWLVCRIGLYALFAILIGAAGPGPRRKRAWIKGAVLATCFAVFTEALKPFVGSRIANVANVATAAGGSALGLIVALVFAGRVSTSLKLTVALLLLIAYITYHEWKPFVFVWDVTDMAARAPTQEDWIPLRSFALSPGATWEIRLAARMLSLSAAMGSVAYGLTERLRRGRMPVRALKATALIGGLGLVLELGQFLVPGRFPSPSHVLFFALGGALGACVGPAVFPPLSRSLSVPPAAGPRLHCQGSTP